MVLPYTELRDTITLKSIFPQPVWLGTKEEKLPL